MVLKQERESDVGSTRTERHFRLSRTCFSAHENAVDFLVLASFMRIRNPTQNVLKLGRLFTGSAT